METRSRSSCPRVITPITSYFLKQIFPQAVFPSSSFSLESLVITLQIMLLKLGYLGVLCTFIIAVGRTEGLPVPVLGNIVKSSNPFCRPVMECAPSTFNYSPAHKHRYFGIYTYDVRVAEWIPVLDDSPSICTSSNPNIFYWKVYFKNTTDCQTCEWNPLSIQRSQDEVLNNPDLKLTSGSYCMMTKDRSTATTPLDPSASGICSQDGELIIKTKPNYEGTRGEMGFIFNSGDYTKNFTIIYGPAGVYPEQSTVYFTEGVAHVKLAWYVFNKRDPSTYKIYYNKQLIADGLETMFHEGDKLRYVVYNGGAKTRCGLPSEESLAVEKFEHTYYTLYVLNPSAASSIGDYVLVVPQDFPEEKSATIKLALNPPTVSAIEFRSAKNN